RGVGRPNDVTLVPFYQIHRQRYSVYWNLLSETDWKAQQAAKAKADAEQAALDARTMDKVLPGEKQSETAHNVMGEKTDPEEALGRKLRHAYDGGWFSYDMKVNPDVKNAVACTWWGDETGDRNFDILVNGKVIASQKLLHNKPGEFWETLYVIPEELTHGKE